MDILKLNPLTKEVEFINENVLFVNEFADVYRRDVPVFGDESTQGRKYNFMEFKYVFHMADWSEENHLRALGEKERHTEAMKESGLSKLPVWRPDAKVKAAITKYVEIQQTRYPTARFLISAERALMQCAMFLETITKQNEHMQERINILGSQLQQAGTGDVTDTVASLTAANALYQTNIKLITQTIIDQDKAEARISELRTKVISEYIKAREVVGGGKLGNRELPRHRSNN